jgi:hypothetical protein
MKCRCPSDNHGHKAGKCKNLATEPDQLCKPRHDKMAKELRQQPKSDDQALDLTRKCRTDGPRWPERSLREQINSCPKQTKCHQEADKHCSDTLTPTAL